MRRAFVSATLALLVAPSALATVAVRMDVGSLAAKASVIAVARVEKVEARREPNSMTIRTHATLSVERGIAGTTRAGTVLDVSVLGGELEGESQPYSAGAEFRAGDRVVVFLEKRKSRTDEWMVVGAFQGLFRIEQERETGLDLAVRDNVRAGVELVGRDPDAGDEPLRIYVEELEARVLAIRGLE